MSPDGTPAGPLTKVAHYQEANAAQEIVPSGLSSSTPPLPLPLQNSDQKLVPVPRGGADRQDDDPDGDEPDRPDARQKPQHSVPPLPAPLTPPVLCQSPADWVGSAMGQGV